MSGTIRASLKKLLRTSRFSIRHRGRTEEFTSSSEYWELRCKTGGNSGAGSYGRLARFKAEFLNRFVEEQHIKSVIEFGCGDGAQLELASYPSYTGVDVSVKAVDVCRSKFKGVSSKRFLHMNDVVSGTVADLSLSLDVIYHLVEDSTFDATCGSYLNRPGIS
jgi:SAM-dependent methyltransferase